MNFEEEKEIAQTILHQIDTIDKWAFGAWGARKFEVENSGNVSNIGYVLGGVSFSISGSKIKRGFVFIYLMGNDTYTIDVKRIITNPYNVKDVIIKTDIYFDQLVDVIDGIIG